MLTAEQYLDLINDRSRENKPLERVYLNMLKEELFINAYGKLYRNKGSLTRGTTKQTADGTSLEKIQELIQKLKERKFNWEPARRIYVPKSDGKERPISIPSWNDRLVQEVIRVILEAYYEPRFSDLSHGFRPKRGCHTALKTVYRWRGTKWFIEGDIKGCFDNINHKKLLDIIWRDIKDLSFRKLLEEMLEAGYMEDWRYNKTYSGTPQGGIVSPILSNIYLNELDAYIENFIIPRFDIGNRRKENLEYKYLVHERSQHREGSPEYQRLTREIRKMPSTDVNDGGFRRLKYVRYADDFILGTIGQKRQAEKVKEMLTEFLENELKLELSQEKTLITHSSEPIRFLGYNISVQRNNKERITNRRRMLNGQPTLEIPPEIVRKWTGKYAKKGKIIHDASRLYQSDVEIVRGFGSELRGLYEFYKFAHNVREISKIKYHLQIALVKTLASKHKTKSTEIYRKYKLEGALTRGIKVVQDGIKATFGGFSITRDKSFTENHDRIPNKFIYYAGNELTRRLLKNKCEIEGCENRAIEGHHIRSLKEIKERYRGRKDPPQWVKFMMKRNRKTIFVCLEHHLEIHRGEYDGPKIVGKH